MRWKTWCAGLALLLTTVAGCKQQCFMTLDDHKRYMEMVAAHEDLETTPFTGNTPIIDIVSKTPPTVVDPERNARYMSLAECIAIGLEQGNVGTQNFSVNTAVGSSGSSIGGGFPGSGNVIENPVTFLGAGERLTSDNIRVLQLDPAIQAATITQSLSRFDANLVTSANWQTINRPVGTAQDTLTSGGVPFIETSAAQLSAALVKPLATGGTAGITFSEQYQNSNIPSNVNPSYSPALTFSFEQPLLQGYGVEINQLRATHPGAIANQQIAGLVQPLSSNEGILITARSL